MLLLVFSKVAQSHLGHGDGHQKAKISWDSKCLEVMVRVDGVIECCCCSLCVGGVNETPCLFFLLVFLFANVAACYEIC